MPRRILEIVLDKDHYVIKHFTRAMACGAIGYNRLKSSCVVVVSQLLCYKLIS